MCQLVQSFERINGKEAIKQCYQVSDVNIIQEFFSKITGQYKQEDKEGSIILLFGDNIKVSIKQLSSKDKKETYEKNKSAYMTVLFNFYDHLTVKPTKELSQEYRFQQIMLPVEASYTFDNELKRYQKQKESGVVPIVQNVLNIVQKSNIEPQMKLENQDLIIAFQTGIEKINDVIFTNILPKFKAEKEALPKLVFHKAPYIPIFPRDDKKEIRRQRDNKTYIINTKDKTDNMKINLSFQCLNKMDKNSPNPIPINPEEIRFSMQKFALCEATRLMKQHEQAFKWLSEMEKKTEQQIENFYSKNNPKLNNENRDAIEKLYQISLNNKIGNYQFSEQGYGKQIQQVKNLAQYVMSQLIKQPELKNQEQVLIDLCNDKLHQKQYQCQMLQQFIGGEDQIQTNVVDFIDLVNMFTTYYPQNKYTLNVCPLFKFGKRLPEYPQKNAETGEIEPPAQISTMTMETKLIIKQILTEPQQLQNDFVGYVPDNNLASLDDLDEQMFD